MYAAADRLLGRLVKVTPSSKVVGDLALHLVATGADPEHFAEAPQDFDIPDSVIGFLGGELGTPPAGWPEPFRSKALQGRSTTRRTVELSAQDRVDLAGDSATRRDRLNHLLFPAPTKELEQVRAQFGDVSVLDTMPTVSTIVRPISTRSPGSRGGFLVTKICAPSSTTGLDLKSPRRTRNVAPEAWVMSTASDSGRRPPARCSSRL